MNPVAMAVAGERFERLSTACEEKYQKIAQLHRRGEALEESIRQVQSEPRDPSLNLTAAKLQLTLGIQTLSF
jgi:hypothetical protein